MIKQTIMVVDDSASMRQMLSFTLDQAGYGIIEAENGLDAEVKLQDRKVDMFIVDLHMPHLDGFSLTRSLRSMSQYRAAPILILTVLPAADRKDEALTAGVTEYINKPFQPEQLLHIVDTIISRKISAGCAWENATQAEV